MKVVYQNVEKDCNNTNIPFGAKHLIFVHVHVQNFRGGGWQAVSLGGGVTVMENGKFW